MKKKRIIIIPYGLPLSGKTTFSKAMHERYSDIFGFGTGDYFRALKTKPEEERTDLDREIINTLEAGYLIEDSIVTEIVKQELNKLQKKIDASGVDVQVILLDGYPRTSIQLRDVENEHMFDDDEVIYVIIDVDEEVCRSRVNVRRVCADCGEVYQIAPEDVGKEDLTCEKCGGLLVTRKDDANFETRVVEYNEKTVPMLPEIEERHSAIRLKANDGVRTVIAPIFAIVDACIEKLSSK